MSEYSWNRTGEIDEFARTLEQKLHCITPQPGTLALPPEIEEEVERGRHFRARELWIGASIVLILAGIGLALLAT